MTPTQPTLPTLCRAPSVALQAKAPPRPYPAVTVAHDLVTRGLFSLSFSRQAVSNGFSLTVTILNDFGRDTRTEEYYRGCKLILRARSLKKFTGLYVAGVSAEGLWEGFEVSLV